MLRDLSSPKPSFAGIDAGPMLTVQQSLQQMEEEEWEATADANVNYCDVSAVLHARDHVSLHAESHAPPSPVIVVDRVGILADLYGLADVAFVGGGYHRAGLHSVLEPAVFGVPVAVGPHWHMSRDAALLIERGGAVALPADGRHPLHSQWLVWHHDPAARGKAGEAGKRLVRQGRGAAERTTALVRALVEA